MSRQVESQPSNASTGNPGEQDLYAQATSLDLDRAFPSTRVEYLLLDLPSQHVTAMRWSHPDRPMPVGSLLKPFVALAYGEAQRQAYPQDSAQPVRFPSFVCNGLNNGCWRPAGHDKLALEQALAESCNAYFLALARDVSVHGIAALKQVSAAYDLSVPPETIDLDKSSASGVALNARAMIGLTEDWRITPSAIARAYARLAGQTDEDVPSRLLRGMQMAAQFGGTAARLGAHPGGLLAKTGTAPCIPDKTDGVAVVTKSLASSTSCIANGDGLVIVLEPAIHPRLLLLVRERGTTGANAAEVAGHMLSRIESYRPESLHADRR